MGKYLILTLIYLIPFHLQSQIKNISTSNKITETQQKERDYIFFLHNKFTEEHKADELHPEYGKSQYVEILEEFKKEGFVIYSEKRPSNTDVKIYARKVVKQIDSLLKTGIAPNKITVIGTSKGGYIAQYVSTYLANPKVNFVFIGSYQETDLKKFSDINYCGNILTIYEKSDPFGVSSLERKKTSTCEIKHFKEIELNNGLGHGFLFKPLKEWIEPTIKWAKGNYNSL